MIYKRCIFLGGGGGQNCVVFLPLFSNQIGRLELHTLFTSKATALTLPSPKTRLQVQPHTLATPVSMGKTVAVVAAHADDEALGCGGTIARHVAQGDTVHLVLIADGVTSRLPVDDGDADRRMAALKAAQHVLGIESVTPLCLPDNQMDSLPLLEIVQRLTPVLARLRPHVVYTHHHGDLNVDHRLTHEAVMTACRPVPGASVTEIYGFEVLSSTEWATPHKTQFVPTMFVDVSDQVATKMQALEAYFEEMRPEPHSRSMHHVKVLAQHRGCSVGVDAAEAFEVYRVVRSM